MNVGEMGISVVVLGDEVFVVEVFGLFVVGFLWVLEAFGWVCAHYILVGYYVWIWIIN